MTKRRPNHPCKPRLVRLTVGYEGEEPMTHHYAAPDDGRPLEDLTLSDLRPWPVMDANAFLMRVMESRKEQDT